MDFSLPFRIKRYVGRRDKIVRIRSRNFSFSSIIFFDHFLFPFLILVSPSASSGLRLNTLSMERALLIGILFNLAIISALRFPKAYDLDVVKEMLDLREDSWDNPNTKYVDLGCSTGTFLIEVVARLDKSLAQQIPDRQERLKHILEKQLFGYESNKVPYLMAKAAFRILFGDIGVEPNLVLLGSPLEFSKRKVKEMKNKFDDCIVVGNPPYQGSRSPAGGPAKAIYHKFVQFAKELNPSKIIMITPSRWFSGGMGLSSFRQEMLNDRRIKKIVDYPSALECFPGVSIKGGVSYFLWDKDKGYDDNCEITTVINGTIDGPHKRPLNQYDILVRLNGTILVLEKMEAKKGLKTTMESQVKAGCPFGLKTDFKNYKKDPFDSCIKVYGNRWRGSRCSLSPTRTRPSAR